LPSAEERRRGRVKREKRFQRRKASIDLRKKKTPVKRRALSMFKKPLARTKPEAPDEKFLRVLKGGDEDEEDKPSSCPREERGPLQKSRSRLEKKSSQTRAGVTRTVGVSRFREEKGRKQH